LQKNLEQDRRNRIARRSLLLTGVLLLLVGVTVLLGWLTQSRAVVQLSADFEPMKFNTALLFTLLGVTLVAASYGRAAFAAFFGALVSFFALATISQYVFGWTLGIDNLFSEPFVLKRPVYPGRFSITTGICFSLAGVSAALYAARPDSMKLQSALFATTAGGIILALSVPSLFGYISGTHDYYVWGAAVGMALHTALLFAVLGICLLRLFFLLPARHMGWLPLPVFAICAVLTVAIWHATVTENQNRQQSIVRAETDALARNAALYFEGLFGAIDRMDRRWEMQGGTHFKLWQEDTLGYLKAYPVLQALSWADRGFTLKWLHSIKGVKPMPNLNIAFDGVRKKVIDCAVTSREPCRTPVIKLLQGGMGFLNYNPLYAGDKFQGLLVSSFIVADIVGNLVPQSLLADFNVVITEGGNTIFTTAAAGAQQKFSGTSAVAKFRDKEWVFTLSPTPVFIEKNSSYLPGLVIFVGLTISFLVALNTHLAMREQALRRRLQHSRDQIAKFIKNLPVSFAACDTDMRYLMVSDAWYHDFRLKDQDIIGKNHFDVFYNAPPHWREILERCLKEGRGAESEERVELPSGREIWMKWVVRPWHDEHGQVGGLMVATEITTARKRAEHELLLAKQLSDAANRAKSDFLAEMSHEIRTPLNAVIGMARLLTYTSLDKKQAHYAETILHSSEALIKIVSDVLDLGKVEAGKVVIEKSPFNLHVFSRSIAEVFSMQAEQKSAGGAPLAFRLSLDPGCREWVSGDALRLRQILFNLCGNAVKFTEQGAVTLSVACLDRAGGRSLLRFSVADTGIGIPADKLETVFGKYDQAGPAVARRFGGTGLGLALARNFAVMMDSDISVKSVMGEGSTFTMDLWLDDAQPVVEAEQAAPEMRFNAARVLVADDSAINREIMAGLLARCGITPDFAEDGQAAVAAAAQGGYDLVFMDCMMPVMNGYEATAKIRALAGAQAQVPDARARVPIIALTANALKDDPEKCRAAGMDDYLSKPIVEKTLHAALARWLPASKVALPQARPAAAGAAAAVQGIDRAMLAETQLVLGPAFAAHLLKYEADARRFLRQLAAGEDAGDLAYRGHYLRSAALHFGGGEIIALMRQIEKNPPGLAALAQQGLAVLDGFVDEMKAAGAWPPGA
jgi:PAS domain S-box-containing protein